MLVGTVPTPGHHSPKAYLCSSTKCLSNLARCTCVCVSVCLSLSVLVRGCVSVSARARLGLGRPNAEHRPEAPGSRCRGTGALTWALARRQPPSSSHPHRWGPAIPEPARARNRDTLPEARGKLHTRNLAGARQTCGRERGAAGVSGSRPLVEDSPGPSCPAPCASVSVLPRGGSRLGCYFRGELLESRP